tara:strand:- start:68 stop:208 length:141 start_codon:yes stop_codon:yes gene_type:complete
MKLTKDSLIEILDDLVYDLETDIPYQEIIDGMREYVAISDDIYGRA